MEVISYGLFHLDLIASKVRLYSLYGKEADCKTIA